MKSKEDWKALVLEIDPTYVIDDSAMPEQEYTAQEYRYWATEAGATWDGETSPLDGLVEQYGR